MSSTITQAMAHAFAYPLLGLCVFNSTFYHGSGRDIGCWRWCFHRRAGKCINDCGLGRSWPRFAFARRWGWVKRCCLFVLARITIIGHCIDQFGPMFNRHLVFLYWQYSFGGMSKARHSTICVNKLGHVLWRVLSGVIFAHQPS